MLITNQNSLKIPVETPVFSRRIENRDNKFILAYVHLNDAKRPKWNSASVRLRMNGASTQYYPTIKTTLREYLLRRGWTRIGLIPKPLCGQERRPWSRASPPHPPSRPPEEVQSLGRGRGRAQCLLPVQTHLTPRLVSSGKQSPHQPAPVWGLACVPTPGPSLKPGGRWEGRKGFSGWLSKANVSTALGACPRKTTREAGDKQRRWRGCRQQGRQTGSSVPPLGSAASLGLSMGSHVTWNETHAPGTCQAVHPAPPVALSKEG